MTVARLRVIDPTTGAVCAEVRAHGPDDVRKAFESARLAQPAWGALPFVRRAALLRQFARRLMLDPELVPIICRESGKPRFEAEGMELFYTCELTRYYTGRAGRRALADDLRHPFIFSTKRARVVQHPRGVVGVLGPWNFPLLNNFADCIAPLVCGNAVVLKPSPLTPLTSLRVAALWHEAGLPENVFQVVVGGADVGEALVDQADQIFFTGSHAVGQKVAVRAAERMIPFALELGGKSAMVVLADADLPRAARAAVWSAFAHSGQICIRAERVIVEEPAADAFTQLCVTETKKLRQGVDVDRDEAVDVGAMTFFPQIVHVEKQIENAVAQGARVVAGGKRRADLPGQFFEPTVLAGVTPGMDVAREETFGPLLPILPVPDAEQALALANDSPYGLSGSVWSRDKKRAGALAARLQSGSVCVNDTLLNYFCVEAPLGGVKKSGTGVRHGPEALRQFCRVETIIEDHPLLGWMSPFVGRHISFPYNGVVLRIIRWLMRRIY